MSELSPKLSSGDLTVVPEGYRSIVSLMAGVTMVRMLGLFMLFPLLTIYSLNLGASGVQIGLIQGAYPLMQALLQIPFGLLSDRIGRKPAMLLGLVLFILGSIVCALVESATGLIIGRALQGCGAVAAVASAWVADVTPEDHRAKAMALIGMCIGLAFILALVLGPALANVAGVSGVFWLTALLALVALGLVWFRTISPQQGQRGQWASFSAVLRKIKLLNLNLSIFCLHALLMSNFIALPLLISDVLGIHGPDQWWFYLTVMVMSLIFMLPGVIIGEKRKVMPKMMLLALMVLLASQLMLVVFDSAWAIWLAVILFFSGFNLLEAGLPAAVSKQVVAHERGAAMGVYSSSQFAGGFVGSLFGGVSLALGGPFLGGAILIIFLVCYLAWQHTKQNF